MKFTITFKDPDGVSDCVSEAARESLAGLKTLSARERESLEESRSDALRDAIRPWVEYGEYLEVEFDTDAGTATVVRRK